MFIQARLAISSNSKWGTLSPEFRGSLLLAVTTRIGLATGSCPDLVQKARQPYSRPQELLLSVHHVAVEVPLVDGYLRDVRCALSGRGRPVRNVERLIHILP